MSNCWKKLLISAWAQRLLLSNKSNQHSLRVAFLKPVTFTVKFYSQFSLLNIFPSPTLVFISEHCSGSDKVSNMQITHLNAHKIPSKKIYFFPHDIIFDSRNRVVDEFVPSCDNLKPSFSINNKCDLNSLF